MTNEARYTYTVEGTGEFPRDMLRYDDSQPLTPADAEIVEAEYCNGPENGDSILFDGTKLRRLRVRLVTTNQRIANRPTLERWESFCWRVVEFPTRITTTPTDYPYIRAWDRLMHSNAGWTEVQLQRARQENAPPTAIYRTIEGVWSTFEQIESAHTKTLIERFVSERG